MEAVRALAGPGAACDGGPASQSVRSLLGFRRLMSTSAHLSLVPDHDPRGRRESCDPGASDETSNPCSRQLSCGDSPAACPHPSPARGPRGRPGPARRLRGHGRGRGRGRLRARTSDSKRYFLDEQNLGQRFELKVNESQGTSLKTGARIRVRGVSAGGALSADTQARRRHRARRAAGGGAGDGAQGRRAAGGHQGFDAAPCIA